MITRMLRGPCRLAALLGLVLLSGPGALAAHGSPNGEVTALQILPAAERTELVIGVSGAVETRDFTMEGPYRLVVDLLGAKYALGEGAFAPVERGGVRAIRASQYAEDVVRVVLELDVPSGYQVLTGDGYVRVSLDTGAASFEPWASVATATNERPSATAVVAAPAPEVRRRASGWSGLQTQGQARPITVSFTDTPMRDVLFTFAEWSGRSIVPGANVGGSVNATIQNQPWDIALQTILESYALAARETESGIIRVDRLQDLTERRDVEQLVTRPFRISFGSAQDMVAAVQSLLSDRGQVAVSAATNSLVVTDVPGVLEAVEELLSGLDMQTPEITISAKIIFVNRTDLERFGVVYDLKDTQGNQINRAFPGGFDFDGDGNIDEIVTDDFGITLRGNSIAALGNANQVFSGASIEFLTTLVLRRMSLIAFVQALEQMNMSDIQASPQVRVLENRLAKIQVGERTPVAGVQTGTGAQQGEGLFLGPAPVELVETGIILEVTPTVTAGDLIFMTLRAERSGVEVVSPELGYRFNTQEANTHVLVEDGETVVIGGLTVTEIDEVRSGIPVLMRLPFLGRFFRTTTESRNQQDLIILVTPEIVRR